MYILTRALQDLAFSEYLFDMSSFIPSPILYYYMFTSSVHHSILNMLSKISTFFQQLIWHVPEFISDLDVEYTCSFLLIVLILTSRNEAIWPHVNPFITRLRRVSSGIIMDGRPLDPWVVATPRMPMPMGPGNWELNSTEHVEKKQSNPGDPAHPKPTSTKQQVVQHCQHKLFGLIDTTYQ